MRSNSGTEHPQRQHIPEQVHDATVQEHIGYDLPDGKGMDDQFGDQDQMLHKLAGLELTENQIKEGNCAGGDQQPFSSRREAARGERIGSCKAGNSEASDGNGPQTENNKKGRVI